MKRKKEAIVGLVTIIAFALLVIFTINIKKALFFSRTYDIQVNFKKIKGLEVGAPVYVYGVVAGEVNKIEYISGNFPVSVVISIKSDITIYQNAKIRVATSGLIGETYIEIEAGTSDFPPLLDSSSVNGQEMIDMYDLISMTPNIVEDVSISLKSLRELITDEQNRKSISDTISRMDSITAKLDSILYDSSKNINEAVLNLKQVTLKTTALIERIDQIIAASEPNIKRATGSLNQTIENIRDETNFILTRTSNILDRIGTTTLEISIFLSENKTELSKLSSNLAQASQRLNEIIDKIDKGKGTIGLLVNDPQPFYSLRDTLFAIQNFLLGPQPDPALLNIPYQKLDDPHHLNYSDENPNSPNDNKDLNESQSLHQNNPVNKKIQ